MLKVALAVLPKAHGKGQPTGPRGEVPKWTYFPKPASKIGLWHTADHVLPPIGGFRGQLCSRLIGFADGPRAKLAVTLVTWRLLTQNIITQRFKLQQKLRRNLNPG